MAADSCRDGWNVRNELNVPKIIHSVGERIDCVCLLVSVALLRIFSFILQRQRMQRNCMNHTYQTTKHTNTTRTTKTMTSTWVSPLTQSLYSYNWGNANSGVFIFKLRNKSTNFVHFIHHQFVQFIDPKKPVCGLMNNFVHFIHPNQRSNQDLFRAEEVWAKKRTILLIHTNKIIIYCCKDLLFWPFKLFYNSEIDAKCIYFQLRKDGKN